jgi:hypothetical protein
VRTKTEGTRQQRSAALVELAAVDEFVGVSGRAPVLVGTPDERDDERAELR